MQLSLIEPASPPSPLPAKAEPWKAYGRVSLYHGDCIEVLRAMPPRSIDACVTDPPYGLGFMGKEWDTFKDVEKFETQRLAKNKQIASDNTNLRGRNRAPAVSASQIDYDRDLTAQRAFQRWCEEWAREVYRVLRPGGHLLSCGAPRSGHRMISGIEDAGFEIRDGLAWIFGQGFPKSHNLEGGWGTALKPAYEPICVARKPFEGTVEENVAMWGVGALNIDGCRVETAGHADRDPRDGLGGDIGRWPPNVAMDEETAEQLDAQVGPRKSGNNPRRRGGDKFRKIFGSFKGEESCVPARGADSGGPSRFFFVPKPSRAERDFGCDDLPLRTPGECTEREEGSAGITPYAGAGRSGGGRNTHPTVKPVALMRWLLRLVVPPTVLYCHQCKVEYKHNATPETGDIRPVRAVRQDVSGGGQERPTDPPILRPEVLESGDGSHTSWDEGLRHQREGLQADSPTGASNVESRGVRDGAPPRDGRALGPTIDSGRSSASRERRQVRQPAGEPRSDAKTSSRPKEEAAKETDSMPALPRPDQSVGTCPKCGGDLVSRPGCVLDPFLGSGTTGMAAAVDGYQFIGIDRELDYLTVSDARISAVVSEAASSSRPAAAEGAHRGQTAPEGLPSTSPVATGRQECLESSSQPDRGIDGDGPSQRDRAHCLSPSQGTDGQDARNPDCHSDEERVVRRRSGRRASRTRTDGLEHDARPR